MKQYLVLKFHLQSTMMWSSLIIAIYILHHSKADLQISECGDGKLTVDEKAKSQTLTCSYINTILNVWDIVLSNGTVMQFASCRYPDGCSSNQSSLDTQYFTATRPDNNSSVLTITGNFRNIITGKVRCGELGGGTLVGNATCDVRVVYSAADLGGLIINTASNIEWMLTGSFTAIKVFASDGQYSCSWMLDGSPDKEVNGNVTLAPFTDNGLQYYNATCSFAVPVTEVEGRYIGFLTAFEPGHGSAYSQISVNITKPTTSATLNNCSTSVEKGTSFTCTCRAANAIPPAIVTWGVNYPLHNYSQETITVTAYNSSNYTCRQYWGNSITYNISVHTVIVTEPTTTTTPASPSGTDPSCGCDTYIAVVIALAVFSVILTIVIILFIVYFMRDSTFCTCDPLYAKRATGTPEEHPYTELTVSGQATNPSMAGHVQQQHNIVFRSDSGDMDNTGYETVNDADPSSLYLTPTTWNTYM